MILAMRTVLKRPLVPRRVHVMRLAFTIELGATRNQAYDDNDTTQ